jgi:hypothetical protein
MPEAFVSSERKITLQRKELYDRVWRTPMRTLAKEFGLPDAGLAKIIPVKAPRKQFEVRPAHTFKTDLAA